jgi:cystathionine gamma-synthase
VYLFGAGMNAIYTVSRAIQRLFPARPSVQFGFPYVDTLKLQQDCGPGCHFFPRGDERDAQQLQELLRAEPVSAVFCEFPSNPLLVSPDLATLAELAQRQAVPLVVDETLSTYVNVDLRLVADVLITSLTKYFAGAGDVLAGAAIVNPGGRLYEPLRAALECEYEDTLWAAEAALLAQHATDFPERVQRINQTAERVCEYCRAQPLVAEVYYPKFCTPGRYAAFQRPGGGFGGLFSLLLKNPLRNAPLFYDALPISKGPSLGTDFSLCCPFTLLAHYRELDWAESCGVSRYLVRVSVGLEEPQELIDRLDLALRAV